MYVTTPSFFVYMQYIIMKFRKRDAHRSARPLRLTSALFTPGQLGNSISTNYHSFRKKDKRERESNVATLRLTLSQSLRLWRNARKIFDFTLVSMLFVFPTIEFLLSNRFYSNSVILSESDCILSFFNYHSGIIFLDCYFFFESSIQFWWSLKSA